MGFEAVGLTPPDRRTGLSIVGLSLDVAFRRLVAPEHAHLVPAMAEAYRSGQASYTVRGKEIPNLTSRHRGGKFRD